MIVATQRPSVDVLTGVIKANPPPGILPGTQTDSRTILDANGAEKPLDAGICYFCRQGLRSRRHPWSLCIGGGNQSSSGGLESGATPL
jgi:DNA segregation ATPase FtsK/SpoIIIE-like protein